MQNQDYRASIQRYGIALVAVAGGALVRGTALGSYLGEDAPLLVFVLPVMLSAWLGGVGPGLVATVLSALVGTYLFIEPYYSLDIADTTDKIRVCIFLFEGVFISLICQRMLSARQRAEQSESDALHNASELAKTESQTKELLKRELEMRQKAEAAGRARDEFLATLSHELRNPLNAILGWTVMLRKGELDAAAAERAYEVIDRNTRAQAKLIEDLLEVSLIINGKLRLDLRPVKLIKITEEAIDAVRPTADAKSLRLQAILDPHVGPVSGDPDRLQQVVWNLLSNAIKFTPKGGRVQIRLERVNSEVELTVLDSGPGIDPDFLPHVFERFRQADGTSTRKHGGLGLGLAIVRHIVELHAGTVRAENADGENNGACFTVRLPLAGILPTGEHSERHHPAALDDLGIPEELPAELVGVRILAVEDDADTRSLLQTLLADRGAILTVAASAAEGLNSLRCAEFDVLISDIEMPGMDGYEFIKQVRSSDNAACRAIPAIAVTAYARSEDRVRAISAGFQMHIPKPVEPKELVAVISSLVGWNSARQEKV